MILWIFIIVFSISIVWCHLCKTDQRGKKCYGRIGKFCSKLEPTALASTVISGFLIMIVLIGLVIAHIEFHSLVVERNAVQMTLDTYRKSIDMHMLEKVGAIQQVFEINKQIAVAKYWHSSIWFGVFWPDGVVELNYIK